MSQTVEKVVRKSIALLVMSVDREVIFAEPSMIFFSRPIYDFMKTKEELRDYSKLTEEDITEIVKNILSERELENSKKEEKEDTVLKEYGLSIMQYREIQEKLDYYFSSAEDDKKNREKRDKECLENLIKLEAFVKLNGDDPFTIFLRLKNKFETLGRETQLRIIGELRR